MGLLGNTLRALGRLRHGKGFGIHSPFAYTFIREVLRLPDKYGYYAYHEISRMHHDATEADGIFKVIPLKYLKLIFRIGNFFRSEQVIISGDRNPLVINVVSLISPDCKVIEVEPSEDNNPESIRFRSTRKSQATTVRDISSALPLLNFSGDSARRPLVIITGDEGGVTTLLNSDSLMAMNPVFIVLNLKHNRRVWNRIAEAYNEKGMSFANPHIAVMVTDSGLPRQHFNIWI